ncbi:hypothetical protein EXIGLDRAFT_314970 [Exidia glandulosa HHB12029]|uniref:F-box domain-containing protein n=1 Tax=Exidia glandulosa HHB12029 TaxID=1314781 RepID=A0A165CY67_EXIGL|nr:hypothetical protein EXIGLDRAFT_314970 [Exidia glandulosa HHB12029]
MASLPTELWLAVFEYLDPPNAAASLASLARTSKFLWDIVTPILYHTVHFRRSAPIDGFRNSIIAHPTLATHVRIVVFARGVNIPGPALDTFTGFMLPVRARYGTVFGSLTSLAGVHVHESHLPNPPNGSSVGSWLANPKPLVRNLLVTFEDGRTRDQGHSHTRASLERSPLQLPPTPETLHLDHIELSAETPFKRGAHAALRNVSAAVCLQSHVHDGTITLLQAFLMSLRTIPNLSRARIFFPSAFILQLVTQWTPLPVNPLTRVLSDARIQLVVHDFGREGLGYRTAVYAEMCGDEALWSLGDPSDSVKTTAL